MTFLHSVRFRLFAFTAALLLLVIASALNIGRVIRDHQLTQLRLEDQHQRLEIVLGTQSAMSNLRYWVWFASNTGVLNNDPEVATRLPGLLEARAALERQLAQLGRFDRPAVDTIRTALEGYVESTMRMIQALRSFQNEAIQREGEFIGSRIAGVERVLNEVRARELAAARLMREDNRVSAEAARRGIILTMLITILGGGALMLLILRSVVHPLRQTVDALNRVNAGDTSAAMPEMKSSEFGAIAMALTQFRDRAARLDYLARNDALTGLPNRAAITDQLGDALSHAPPGAPGVGLMFIDFDHFRLINNAYGHGFGDRCLLAAAQRLRLIIPQSVPLARFSGDLFAAVFAGLPLDSAQEQMSREADAVLTAMSRPVEVDGHPLVLAASIGIAISPVHGRQVDQIIGVADGALYEAKQAGRNNAQFGSHRTVVDARERLDLAADMRRAADSGEFSLYYQPIVDANRGVVIGSEALMRWNHPQRGLCLPGSFIGVAEETGLITSLTPKLIKRACAQGVHWQIQQRPLRIGFNFSASQLRPSVVEVVREALNASGLPGKWLEVEITESAMMARPEQAADILRGLKSLGVSISLDDFGTGYSSLSYLQRFPIDKIKIDGSFIARLCDSRESEEIVAATVALAASLNMQVVAEGVENVQQSRRLLELGCVQQQGFYFSKAMPANELERWVAQWEKRA